MNQPIDLLVVHDGKTENNDRSKRLADVLSVSGSFQFLSLVDTEFLDGQMPANCGRIFPLFDREIGRSWSRVAGTEKGLPAWAKRFKYCYLIGPEAFASKESIRLSLTGLRVDMARALSEAQSVKAPILEREMVLPPMRFKEDRRQSER